MSSCRRESSTDAAPAELRFVDTAGGTEVQLVDSGLTFVHSFVDGELARRSRQSSQALLKACNNRRRQVKSVLDVTAGWGADALTLARHGYQVTMIEREPQVQRVLRRSLDCLRRVDAQLADRLQLVAAEAGDFLNALSPATGFDCIYLDPMFPPHKSGAKPAKPMQVLQALAHNSDIATLFELARQQARRRVVVKRPARAKALGGKVAALVYREKSVRFDVYPTGVPGLVSDG